FVWPGFHNLAEFGRQLGRRRLADCLAPSDERLERIGGGLRLADDGDVVPVADAAVLSERDASEGGTGLDTQIGEGHGHTDPLAGDDGVLLVALTDEAIVGLLPGDGLTH